MFAAAAAPKGNIFAKEGEKDGDSSDGAYKNEDDEPPTVVLGDDVNTENPFKKVFEKQVDKFKIAIPAPLKKNLGQGKVSIQTGEFGEDKKTIMTKVVFRNSIGKTLYEANVTGKFSKLKKVTEKSTKNQVKIALVKINPETKAPRVEYCLINFQRSSDMEEFVKEF